MTTQANETTQETISATEALAIVTTLHGDTLALQTSDISSERADKLMNRSGTQTTTELLLLLARFHADADDEQGAQLLARFAVEFAALESTVV